MDKIIKWSSDLDENGNITIFHLPTGDLELYNNKARILFESLIVLGFKLVKAS